MSVLPDTRVNKIEFCEEHLSAFAANAVAIGTTEAAVTDLQTKTEEARAAYQAAKQARNAAKALTNTFYEKTATMTTAVASIISQIKAKANTSGNQVYDLAQIPAPAQPSPIGPLGAATDFTVGLEVTGALNLTWKATQPKSANGVTYQIWRRIGHIGPFVCLGGTGAKNFQDSTVPAGSATVTYQVQATRSTSVSPWAQFIVSFGMDSSGTMIASVTQGTPVNLAA